jgi:preprotein translocase subunit SecB
MATHVEQKHLTGVRIDWLYVREVVFVDDPDKYGREPLPEAAARIDVRQQAADDQRSCRVYLRISFGDDDSLGLQLSAAVEAQFSLMGEESAVNIEEFMMRQGPVILMPFLRDALATATSKSRIGTVLLPPINVLSVLEGIAAKKTTGASDAKI